MAEAPVKHCPNARLRDALTGVVQAIAAALKTQIQRDVVATPHDPELADGLGLLTEIEHKHVVVRGRVVLGQDSGDEPLLRLVLDARDAAALAGQIAMRPDEIVAQMRAAGDLAGETHELFAEVGNLLLAAAGRALHQVLGEEIRVRLEGFGVIAKGEDQGPMLEAGPAVLCRFGLRTAPHPESTAFLLVEWSLAERWNDEPLSFGDDGEIPQAPIRGRLVAFLVDQDALPVVRASCRRVGLELDRHARTEVPNPTAHRGAVVLLDVPSGDQKRFDWCRRLKHFGQETKVVLLLHHPSRSRVVQGYLAQADVILGWPLCEAELSPKLDGLLAAAEDAPGESPGPSQR